MLCQHSGWASIVIVCVASGNRQLISVGLVV